MSFMTERTAAPEPDLLAYVRARLLELGPQRWPAVAKATRKPITTLRKIAYGDRLNPQLNTIQPIANHLRSLPQ